MKSSPETDAAPGARDAGSGASGLPIANSGLQKAWLVSASLAVLQLRVPGKNLLLLVDARGPRCALVQARPASPEPALPAQATLRRLLEGGRVLSLGAEAFADAPDARRVALRLSCETPQGPRALVAEPRAQALFVLAPDPREPGAERVVWAAPGAPAERRSGARWPAVLARSLPAGAEAGAEAEAVAQDATALAARELARTLAARVRRLERTLQAVEGDRARAAQAVEERRRAELLLPHQARVPRGAREAVVPDWSRLDEHGAPAQVALALDPALSAAENAARWLKRAHRYGAAAERIGARAGEVGRALAAARGLLERARAAPGAGELRLIAEEAARSRPPREGEARRAAGRREEPAARLPFRAFRTSAGARVLVGRGAADNDALTLRWAKGNDLWLHARGVQGSHVIVPEPGAAPDPRTLAEAALLAAWFSSARGEDGAEVSWTRRKHVRKAKGAPPGAVTYTQERTVRVRLDEALLRALLETEGR